MFVAGLVLDGRGHVERNRGVAHVKDHGQADAAAPVQAVVDGAAKCVVQIPACAAVDKDACAERCAVNLAKVALQFDGHFGIGVAPQRIVAVTRADAARGKAAKGICTGVKPVDGAGGIAAGAVDVSGVKAEQQPKIGRQRKLHARLKARVRDRVIRANVPEILVQPDAIAELVPIFLALLRLCGAFVTQAQPHVRRRNTVGLFFQKQGAGGRFHIIKPMVAVADPGFQLC